MSWNTRNNKPNVFGLPRDRPTNMVHPKLWRQNVQINFKLFQHFQKPFGSISIVARLGNIQYVRKFRWKMQWMTHLFAKTLVDKLESTDVVFSIEGIKKCEIFENRFTQFFFRALPNDSTFRLWNDLIFETAAFHTALLPRKRWVKSVRPTTDLNRNIVGWPVYSHRTKGKRNAERFG